MDEGPRRLPKLVHLGGLFLGQDLRVQREGRWARQFTLLLVLPGLQRILKCLGHENPVLYFLLLWGGECTCTDTKHAHTLTG